MGLGQSQIIYSVQVPGQQQPQNETKVRRSPEFIKELQDSPGPHLKTMQDIVLNSFQKHATMNCFGTIVTETLEQQGKQIAKKSIRQMTFSEVSVKAKLIGKAIVELKLAPETPGSNMKFVGIYSKNRVEWVLVDLACILFGFTVVPLYDTLGCENIPYVFEHTELENLFVTKQSAEVLVRTDKIGKIRSVVSFDPLNEETVKKLEEKGLTVYSLSDLYEIGKKCDHPLPKISPDQCLTFSYTSGTTGPPKGAMISHRNFASFCRVLETKKDIQLSASDVYLSYLPLPHLFERICMFGAIYVGANVIFYSGDIMKIKDDLEIAKPTIFASVPRLYNRFYDIIKAKFQQAEGWGKTLLDKALATKLHNVNTNGGYTHKLYDRIVFNKTKSVFGGRLRLMLSGSAPLRPAVHSFIKVIACAPLLEGYGQTESTGASFGTQSHDPVTGHVGGPMSNIEFKLVDLPEMQYTRNDVDENGRLAPRGEVCLRGPGVFLGYYKDPEKTAQVIDADGWLHTGDIAVLLPGTGALKIIDRKKNIFKLQQGQYVAAEKVESIYLKNKDIREIFLHGESTQTFAVAVIVPNNAAIETAASSLKINGSFEQLLRSKEVRAEYLKNVNGLARKEGLNGFELTRNVYFETESFQTKGLTTDTLKIKRHEAKNQYKEAIEQMYKEGMLEGPKS